jgi:hypothetical protein
VNLWKSLALILVVLLLVETGYIFTHRNQANRFQPVKDYEGLMAIDTATGRMCRTMPTLPPKSEHEESTISFVRGLPACWDIR